MIIRAKRSMNTETNTIEEKRKEEKAEEEKAEEKKAKRGTGRTGPMSDRSHTSRQIGGTR